MNFNPKKHTIDMFEPGSIQCSVCGHKPEDSWDTSPEGFKWNDQWECEECQHARLIAAAPELLEIVQKLLKTLPGDNNLSLEGSMLRGRALKVIAKALGRDT